MYHRISEENYLLISPAQRPEKSNNEAPKTPTLTLAKTVTTSTANNPSKVGLAGSSIIVYNRGLSVSHEVYNTKGIVSTEGLERSA